MALSLVTAPGVEPVSLAEAKAQCRVEVGDEDTLIQALVTAAREYAETYTRRALMTQTWDLKLDAFPCDSIELPLSPVSSVTSITYTDTAGSAQTWSSTLYDTDLPTGPRAAVARIRPGYGEYYPSTRREMNAVTVRFVAGYGATAATVPASIRAAIKLLVAHWYTQRTPVLTGTIATPVPLTIDALLWPFKTFA